MQKSKGKLAKSPEGVQKFTYCIKALVEERFLRPFVSVYFSNFNCGVSGICTVDWLSCVRARSLVTCCRIACSLIACSRISCSLIGCSWIARLVICAVSWITAISIASGVLRSLNICRVGKVNILRAICRVCRINNNWWSRIRSQRPWYSQSLSRVGSGSNVEPNKFIWLTNWVISCVWWYLFIQTFSLGIWTKMSWPHGVAPSANVEVNVLAIWVLNHNWARKSCWNL